ncbi:unnamed protein product, partial [Mesorhabditis belari]|uniref:Protein kinase domain-containing protein n=1 Tax=Mesorhabditis belari TaxID=2138241 RepID=A0AAF3FC31_9BILA
MDNYLVLSRIGQGSYGVVLKARNVQTSEIVALKKVNLRSRSRLDILREFSTLRNCHSKHIVKLIDIFCSQDTLTMVMEFVERNLKTVINDPNRVNSETSARFYFSQLLRGVRHLHQLGIMHRDLKPENVLVSGGDVVKIADFGQACLYFADDLNKEYEEQVATRWYRAPELLFGTRLYTPTVDIWATGCILAEIWNRSPLFNGRNDFEQIAKIFEILGTPTAESWPTWTKLADSQKVIFEERKEVDNWSNVVPGSSPLFISLLRLQLRLCGSLRSSADSLLQHEFFTFNTASSLPKSNSSKF